MFDLNLHGKVSNDFFVRDALVDDAIQIHQIVAQYIDSGILLPRPVEDIIVRIGNFQVVEKKDTREIVACAALRDFGAHLFEIRSLAVSSRHHNCGIGSLLVFSLLKRAKFKATKAQVFALTTSPLFFQKIGFEIVKKEIFPIKIWADCRFCKKINECDEVAVSIEI